MRYQDQLNQRQIELRVEPSHIQGGITELSRPSFNKT